MPIVRSFSAESAVVASSVHYACDVCYTKVEPTGVMKAALPPLYVHKCPKCFTLFDLDTTYYPGTYAFVDQKTASVWLKKIESAESTAHPSAVATALAALEQEIEALQALVKEAPNFFHPSYDFDGRKVEWLAKATQLRLLD